MNKKHYCLNLKMNKKSKYSSKYVQNMKHKLIYCAGKLFAENGFKETSVRTITKKAKVNISAINYYFGSKEKLYFECVRHCIENMKNLDFLSEKRFDPDKINLQDVSDFLYGFIYQDLKGHLSSKNPVWYIKLLLKTLITKSPVLKKVVYEIFLPEHQTLINIIKLSSSELTDHQVKLWANSIIGQIMFYDFSREILLMLMNVKEFSEEYINTVTDHIASISINGLGLPKPDKSKYLKEGKSVEVL